MALANAFNLSPAADISSHSVARIKRGRLCIVASGPAAEATVTRPLAKEDLIQQMASGCKPKEQWRIGTEHEKFGFQVKDLKPLNYDQIQILLEGLSDKFNWEKVYEEDGKLTALKKDGKSVTLEGGGQVELSGAPLRNVHETLSEVNLHLSELKSVAEPHGFAFMGMGFEPKTSKDDMPRMPRGRYHMLNKHFKKNGFDVLLRTCSVQVNLDFCSEADLVKKLRVGLALQPVITAMFANSPFLEGSVTDYLSYRAHIYSGIIDPRRVDLGFVFEHGFGFERFVDYAMSLPLLFVYRDGQYVDCNGMKFKDLLEGRMRGEVARMSDWENHLTTIYPDVRLKKFLEMRGADGVPWICALPALWVGLLYDETSLGRIYDIVMEWTKKERDELKDMVPKMGLKTPFRGRLVRDLAEEVLGIAKDGLESRGLGEDCFLKEVSEVVESGVTTAERLVELYNGEWNTCVDPVFKKMMY